ncbi:hypothetical protein AK830_g10424 [Neonectria ditissima]|uniref:Xylanolytic transcriptional activator regulatory domain-containing protein n=1 Tax=Neonectria ditissima TaxID=78410 RepID=A0A0N8H5H0_9HYPO|nr:hypothetical protein AK830_g10424 [Neonectria ditissima]
MATMFPYELTLAVGKPLPPLPNASLDLLDAGHPDSDPIVSSNTEERTVAETDPATSTSIMDLDRSFGGSRASSSVDRSESSRPHMAPIDYLDLLEPLPALDIYNDWLFTGGYDDDFSESMSLPKTLVIGSQDCSQGGKSSALAPSISSTASTSLLSSAPAGQRTCATSPSCDESRPASPLSDAPVPNFVGVGHRPNSCNNTYVPTTPTGAENGEPLDLGDEDWRVDDYGHVPRLPQTSYDAIAACLDSTERDSPTISSLELTQSALLSQVCMMFSGDSMLTDIAHTNMAMVATLCRRADAFSETETDAGDVLLSEGNWDQWVQAESKRRLAYCAWVLDTQHIMFFELPSVIPSELLQVQMPCHEPLWEAPSQCRLLELLAETRNPTATQRPRRLGQELSWMYRTRRRPEGLGDFHTLLLSMGVFRDAGRIENASAYLDILRQADSSILQRSQMGWLAIQHNHFLALLLRISPRELFAFSGWRVDDVEREKSRSRLQRWGKKRSYEARCAVFHAAKVFSCLRTHPTRGYHQTQCTLLSSVMIWAYIDCCTIPVVEPTIEGRSGEARVITLRFDKCSPEDPMVAAWLRNGEGARPYLAGVGSLEERGAAARLIKETARLLDTDKSWPLSYRVRFVLLKHYSAKTAYLNR